MGGALAWGHPCHVPTVTQVPLTELDTHSWIKLSRQCYCSEFRRYFITQHAKDNILPTRITARSRPFETSDAGGKFP